MTRLPSSGAAGRTALADDLRVERTLASRDRLAALIAAHGIAGTARFLGRSPSTIRDRARRHGIPPGKPGRRRGSSTQPLTVVMTERPMLAPAAAAMIDNAIRRDRRHRIPATLTQIGQRVQALHAADQAHELGAVEGALADLASLASLTLEHQMRLRSAA